MRPSFAHVRLRQTSSVLLLLFLVDGSAETVRAAAPPPRRATVLAERNRWWREAARLRQQGKLAEATAAAEKMLAIERKLFGPNHAEVAASLEILGALREQQEAFAAAMQARREALAVHVQLYGKENWKTIDARLALAHSERLSHPRKVMHGATGDGKRGRSFASEAGRPGRGPIRGGPPR